jgi:cellulase (glycosyl hydrolase family 5)
MGKYGVVALALAACLLGAPSAYAVETLMQDDAVVLGGPSEATVDAALKQMRELGVDRLRVTASWRSLAPARDATRRPAGFDPADPGAYDGAAVAAVDRAVRLAAANGLRVMLDLAFGAPLWATASRTGSVEVDSVTQPDPAEFAAYARALARRYSGTFVPRGATAPLPRADAFELWNEPNVLVFARPLVRGRTIAAADWYRRLVSAAYPAIKAVRPDATVLIGSTAPNAFTSGGVRGSVAPLAFIRRLACVDESLRPETTGECAGFARVPGDGFSHHPYALGFPPGTMGRDPDTVRIGDLPRLRWLLRTLAARGRLAPGAADIWLTEFGYETNFPVHSKPWTLAQQVRLLAQGEYLARRAKGLRTFPQFLLRDVQTAAAVSALESGIGRRIQGSWQSGLFFEDGTPKPAASSFPLTLMAGREPRRPRAELVLWGHVRTAKRAVRVRVERWQGGAWRGVRTRAPRRGARPGVAFASGPDGSFSRRLPGRAPRSGRFRLAWLRPDGQWEPGPGQAVQALPPSEGLVPAR